MSRTPRLSVLLLDKPCQMAWDEMTLASKDGSVRFCTHCQLNVHDLSAMTADEAEAFLARSAGERTCTRFLKSSDAAGPTGGVVTLDYQPPAHRRRWPIWAAGVAAMAMGAGATAAYRQARTVVVKATTPVPVFSATMGAMVVAPAQHYSPFTPGSGGTMCASNRRSLATQLRSDLSLAPILSRLPDGVAVLDLQYGVYPTGEREAHGRCLVFGSESGASDGESPRVKDMRVLLWLMPPGYSLKERSSRTPANAFPLRHAGNSDGREIFAWSDDAELERVVLDALRPAVPTGRSSAASADWATLLND